MMRYKSIIEKFCRDNSGIVKMIKTIFLFGFLVVFVLFVLLLQNSNLNIEESIFNSINIVSKLILLIVAINFIIRRKNSVLFAWNFFYAIFLQAYYLLHARRRAPKRR